MFWKMIVNVKNFLDKCNEHHINAFAAQAAFFILISATPFLMVFSSLIKYTPLTQDLLTDTVKQIIPAYLSPIVVSLIEQVYHQSIGLISIAAVAAIWSSAKGVQCLTDGLNIVNGCEETRNWLFLRFRAIGYTLALIFAILIMLIVLVFGSTLQKAAFRYLPFLERIISSILGIRFLLLLGILVVFFALIFQMLPNRKATLKSQVPGAALGAISWYGFSFALSIYVEYFHGFSAYGSLATLVLVMLWLYFCMYILLLCAEINVCLEERAIPWKGGQREKRGH